MALVATFGELGLVTPAVSVVPSVLAKFSTVVNPVLYMFFNTQVRTSGGVALSSANTTVNASLNPQSWAS